MAIIAHNRSDVLFRWAGREVVVPKGDMVQKGAETRADMLTRLKAAIEGTDRSIDVDLGPPLSLWQGPRGATRPKPSGSTGMAFLTWDASTSPGVTGYRVYYGDAPGAYFQPFGSGIDVGNVTAFIVTGLTRGKRYYFATTAYGQNIESGFSNEAFKDIP